MPVTVAEVFERAGLTCSEATAQRVADVARAFGRPPEWAAEEIVRVLTSEHELVRDLMAAIGGDK